MRLKGFVNRLLNIVMSPEAFNIDTAAIIPTITGNTLKADIAPSLAPSKNTSKTGMP